MDIFALIQRAVTGFKLSPTYRRFVELEKSTRIFPRAFLKKDPKRDVLICCSLDYLGMGNHPDVIKAVSATVAESGVSSGGSRNLSGTCAQHVLLEEELARFHQKERAVLFNSGYLANHVTMAVLGANIDNCVIISDELNHASIIDGVRSSRSNKIIYKHNDLNDLDEKLSGLEKETPKIVVFESVYSMEGKIAPVDKILEIAKKHGALTILNEVHAIGIFGENGNGIAASLGVSHMVDVVIGSLSKGVGVFGGYIAGADYLVDYVRSLGPGFIFTSSLPPPIVSAALTSVKHLQASDKERIVLLNNSKYLRAGLKENALPLMDSNTHIVPVLVGNSEVNNEVSRLLLEKFNIVAVAVNYPTVPVGTERLRLVVTARHTHEMIDYLVASLNSVWEMLDLKKNLKTKDIEYCV